MPELLSNNNFDADLSDWTSQVPAGGTLEWNGVFGDRNVGCVYFVNLNVANLRLYQEVLTPDEASDWVFYYSLRTDPTVGLDSKDFLIQISTAVGGGSVYYQDEPDILAASTARWHRFQIRDLVLPVSTTLYVQLTMTVDQVPLFVDDVYLRDEPITEAPGWTEPTAGSCADLRFRLQRLRSDLGNQKHGLYEYNEAINRAIAHAPMQLWLIERDATITTVSEQRDYALATLDDLERRHQIRRVLMETSQGDHTALSRWHALQDGAVLTLRLESDPPEADRAITVEYWRPHELLDCTDDEDVTTLDQQWIVYKAMVYLLVEGEAKGLEDPARLDRAIKYYSSLLQQREAEVSRQQRQQLPAPKARTKRRGW